MNEIIFPLKLRMQGEKVTGLQNALKLLLDRGVLLADDEGLRRELSAGLLKDRAQQTFGGVTAKLLARFQVENSLHATGEVDEPTAVALNDMLERLGAFTPSKTYKVDGCVSSRVSAAFGGLRILVVDKAVGGDMPLGEAVTDIRGHYEVSFSDVALRRRAKDQPDLQARVFSGERFLAASEVRYDASTRETLSILLDDKTSTTLHSEHETLIAALAAHYKGNLGDLQETDVRQDITYLANKSGWDARAVALAAFAEQFSAKTGAANANTRIEPAFFYALLRSGVPANEASIYRMDPKTVEGIWNQALKQGVLPSSLRGRLPEAMKQFHRMAAQQLLEGPALAGLSSFKDILAISLSDEGQKQKMADLYARHGHDPASFWKQVQATLGDQTTSRLKLDGQLAYLTLNNASLIRKLHAAAGRNGLNDTSQLPVQGFHRAAKWREAIGGDPIPPEIPGKDDNERRGRYAELLAAQVRLSFPTAAVAEMVKAGETPAGAAEVRNRVHAFLTEHAGEFEIGMQPVAQYVARNHLQAAPEVTREITRIQRVYQITPDDESMNGLLKKDIDSAYAVVRFGRDEFVRAFKDSVGGERNARLIHAKAQQVHTTVLNVALTFLTAKSAPGIGVHSPASVIDPAPSPPANAADVLAYGTLESLFGEMDYCTCDHCRSILSPAAYLVNLLQFLYSDDDQWVSFAQTWKTEHANTPYPFVDQASWNKFQNDWNAKHPGEPLPNTEISPFGVLMSRRPDIQHLPLTCENTNTPLPYIDLVNETLEYYITNGLSLADTDPDPNINTEYTGHNTDGSATPEALLASPQFVSDAAYTALAGENFPAPLPFHQPLENLRRCFRRFEAPLPEVMEALRKSDSLDRASADDYGWRDIWMETLGLSRSEHRLLTERWSAGGATDVMLTVKRLYGFDPGTADGDLRAVLGNAKKFARRAGITYEQLAEVLRTRFVNPNAHLIPRLERLGVSFATLKALKDGTISDAAFDALLAPGIDARQYGGGDVTPAAPACATLRAWVKDNDNYARIMSLLTLTNPSDPEDVCSFDKVELRYTNPDMGTNQLRPFEFIRLIRFIRLWRKLGWNIELTDKAIGALYPTGQGPGDPDDAVNLERLDARFFALLPSLGVLRRVMGLLKLSPEKDLLPLLACVAPIDPHGEFCLYRQMFLSPLRLDDAFAQDGYGNYLCDSNKKLIDHAETLRAAFSLTANEFSLIVTTLGFVPVSTSVNYTHAQPALEQGILDAAAGNIGYSHSLHQLTFQGAFTVAIRDAIKTVPGVAAEFQAAVDNLYVAYRQTLAPLTLANISAVFRRGWLARKLKLSVREFLLLAKFTGFDPFEIPNPVSPSILRLIELIGRLRALGIKPVQALYLIWNEDLSGKSAPAETEITEFARNLRSALTAIESEFARVDDPDGSIARARMALVYGNDAADLFFGLLGDALGVTRVPYTHAQATLEQPILDVLPGRLAYDNAAKELSFIGVMALSTGEALKAVAGVTPEFRAAVDALSSANQMDVANAAPRHITEVPYSHGQAWLEQPILDAAPARIAYDNFRQQLTYSGVLTTVARDALNAVPGVAQAFKDAVESLYTKNQKVMGPFFERYPELLPLYDAYVASPGPLEKKRTDFLEAFLPQLKRRRKRQQALQSLSAAVETDIGLACGLLEDAAVLHAAGDPGRPALDDLTAVESAGLSVQYFDAATGNPLIDATTGNPLTRDGEATLEYKSSGAERLPSSSNTPGARISGVWSGYLEAPENGSYKIRVETDTAATVTLTVNGKPVALTQAGGTWSNAAPVELRAGTLYALSFTVENVKDDLTVRWQTTGRGWEIVPAPYLHSATLVANLRQVYVRFLKAAALAGVLKLTAAEMAHLAAHADYQIGGDGWLNHLSVTGSPDNTTAPALLKAFLALLEFSRIKEEISPGDERLLDILRDPAGATANAQSLLYVLTRWEPASVHELLSRFGKTAVDLSHMQTLRTLYDAYGRARLLGVRAAELIAATTNEPTADVVRSFQAALRARYEESAWLDVIRPINDEMRSMQRDALVAYILHRMRSNPAAAHIDTAEKLFEYFLMDVQMDPCMLTSRIRHALSSVQLFIERGLMNLEPRVSPASIKATQWEWMKRYRVWEANRKVFIWPENWLEPELRDDQSPFFKETMSELLQGDITEDRAAEALVGYLIKLEEVAKLEICGIHYEQNETGTADDIAHVIARTAGAKRKYFYRRREYGHWTPWEKVSLDIEDNPVLPVVWKNRLFLFWLKLVQETQQQTPSTPSATKLANVDPSEAFPNKAPKIVIKAMLSWSEFLSGKWQPSRTSDPARPLKLADGLDPDKVSAFRSDLRLAILFWPNGTDPKAALRVIVSYKGWKGSSFFLYNPFSTPELREGKKGAHFSPKRSFDTTTTSLTINYSDTAALHTIVDNGITDSAMDPHHPLGGNSWDAPFFYEDSRHVFYVTTQERLVPVPQWNDFGITMKEPRPIREIPKLVLKPDKRIVGPPIPYIRQPGFGVVDPSPIERYVTEDAYIGVAIGTPGTVRYGDKEFGPSGSQFGVARTR